MQSKPHAVHFTPYPLAQLALAFSIGIIATRFCRFPLPLCLSVTAGLSLVAVFLLLRHRLSAAASVLLMATCLAGAASALLQRTDARDALKHFLATGVFDADDVVFLEGVLEGPPEFARDRIYLLLRVEQVGVAERTQAASGLVGLVGLFETTGAQDEYKKLNLQYGTRVRVTTKLDRSDKFRNPGVSTLTEYLDRKGYEATGFIKNPNSIKRLGDERVFPPLKWLYDWRQQLQREIDARFSPETAGVLDAALLGNRYNLSRNTAERFRIGGTFHVLVISGLHISFIGGIVFLLVRSFTKHRLLQFVSSNLIVWSYSVAVGAEASVVRAALMFTFVTTATVLFRQASSLNALGGAALALLIKSPAEIFNPSLQLTFLSVLAIVVIAWPLLQKLSAIGRWRPTRISPFPPSCSRLLRSFSEILFWSELDWQREVSRSPHKYKLFKVSAGRWFERYRLQPALRYIFGATVVSTSVQLMLLPLLVVYFHRVSLSSIVLNIGVSALLASVAVVALAGLLVAQVSATLAAPFFAFANSMNWLMVHSVDPFSRLGIASLRVPEYSGAPRWIYGLYYVPLSLLVMAIYRWQPLARPSAKQSSKQNRLRLALVAQLILLVVVVMHPLSATRGDGKLHIDFLDVDQGDAALVTMPDGLTLLIDGGGRPNFLSSQRNESVTTPVFERDTRSIGEAVVSEYLWCRGMDRVDYVLATHADADHIDGLNDVVRNFSVRSAFVARTPINDPEYSKFAQSLSATSTNLERLQAGDVLRLGEVEARVLWPPATTDPEAPSANDDSIVLRLQFHERTILLTGDIEKKAENALTTSQQDLSADVVKVPHHGSKTSSNESFVLATRPSVAIISVGQRSPFGHPHREVVERWQLNGAQVLRTGTSGTLSLVTDGKEMVVKRFVE